MSDDNTNLTSAADPKVTTATADEGGFDEDQDADCVNLGGGNVDRAAAAAAAARAQIDSVLASPDFKSNFSKVAEASTQVFGVVVAQPYALQQVVRILRDSGLQRPSPPCRPPLSSISCGGDGGGGGSTANAPLRRKSANVTPYRGEVPDDCVFPPLPTTSAESGDAKDKVAEGEENAEVVVDEKKKEKKKGYGVGGKSVPPPPTTDPSAKKTYFAVHTVGSLPADIVAKLTAVGATGYVPDVRVQDECCQDPALFEASGGLASTTPIFTITSTSSPTTKKPRFTFIELFAGIGGFRVALEALGGKCLFASELTTEARIAYTANYTHQTAYFEDVLNVRDVVNSTSAGGGGVDVKAVLAGDMTELPDHQFPKHDILTAGFPCQSFCKAGNTKGFGDSRGALFFDVIRVIRACRPKVFLLENVDNLVILDEGFAAAMVLAQLSACGYEVTYKVVNANCAVPQSRKRVYIVGRESSSPSPTSNTTDTASSSSSSVEKSSTDDAVADVFWREWKGFAWPTFEREGGLPVPPLRTFLDSSATRTAAAASNNNRQEIGGDGSGNVVLGAKRPRWYKEEGNGMSPDSLRLTRTQYKSACASRGPLGARYANLDGYARTLISSYKAPSMYSEFVRFEDEDGYVAPPPIPTPTATTTAAAEKEDRDGIEGEMKVPDTTTATTPVPCRYYSLSECKRIMGFPDCHVVFTDSVAPPVGYKLLGNAVCPPVVGPIADAVLKSVGL